MDNLGRLGPGEVIVYDGIEIVEGVLVEFVEKVKGRKTFKVIG